MIERALAAIGSGPARAGSALVRGLVLGIALSGLPTMAVAQELPADDQAVAASEWMEHQVRSVERTLHGAQFRSALGISAQLRDHPAATTAQRVRLEVAHATAAIALGEVEAGEASLRRVLELDPGFSLTAHDSPKLRRALDRARQATP